MLNVVEIAKDVVARKWLYRKLLQHADKLVYTDRDYFVRRVTSEFRNSRQLTKPKEIERQVQVR